MRTHIYTTREKQAIKRWLSNNLTRRESALLNSTLLRTKRNRTSLIADIRLFTTALKKLSAGPKRIKPDDLTTHIFIAPIPVRAYDPTIYTKELRALKGAEENANDESATTSERLTSAETCIRIARTMLTGDDPPRPPRQGA
jgi:hypothetical protein